MEIFFAVQFAYNCRPEFIIQFPVQQKINRFFYRIQIGLQKPGQGRVILRTGFDIDSSHLDEIFFCKIFQNFWLRSVCVKFDRISHLADFNNKIFKVCTQCRFPAGNTDPFQNPGPLFEKTQNFFLRNLRLLGRMQHQRTVLAERTAEIAAAKKDRP